MQGQYERKEKRPYDYCRILLIRITPCKNATKKDKRPYDYDIILLIRIILYKKNGKRKKGAMGQQESHGMDRKIMDQQKIYKEAFG